MEIWKDIQNYYGRYQISNYGRVKSLKRGKELILKLNKNSCGYLLVSLYNPEPKSHSVHQLVAIHFLNHYPPSKLVVNHIDFNRQNNHVDNLQVITNRENTNQKHLKSTSKYTGVSWAKSNNKWHAQININNRPKSLAVYSDEYDAHLAYQSLLEQFKTEIL